MDLIEYRPLQKENLIGESRMDTLGGNFDRELKLRFHGTKVTSDADRLSVDPAAALRPIFWILADKIREKYFGIIVI